LINDTDRRRIINLCKQYEVFSSILRNKYAYEHILQNKASKGGSLITLTKTPKT